MKVNVLNIVPGIGCTQTCPQPLEQHFVSPEHSMSLAHSSWHIPTTSSSTLGQMPGFGTAESKKKYRNNGR